MFKYFSIKYISRYQSIRYNLFKILDLLLNTIPFQICIPKNLYFKKYLNIFYSINNFIPEQNVPNKIVSKARIESMIILNSK